MMQVTRRGFLHTAIVGIAAAAISWRLSQGPTRLTDEQRYTWDQPNPDYSYGIDKEHPWDVLILDEKRGEFITPDELKGRGQLQIIDRLGWPVGTVPAEPPSNTYDDDIDRAFGAYAAVVISQGYIGWDDAGKPGFDAPMKEIDEDVDARIYTTSREFYADAPQF
jgi:hypothetical protein